MSDEQQYPHIERRKSRRFAEPPKRPSYAKFYALALAMLLSVVLVTEYFQGKKPQDFGLQPLQSADDRLDEAPERSAEPAAATASAVYAGEGIILDRRPDGHFWIPLAVDGQTIWFLVDTGASDMVLTPKDAAMLGFNFRDEEYTLTYNTANGEVRAAPVELQFVAYESLEVWNVFATVNEADMPVSLLGQSFLQRLSGFEVQGDRMILRP